MANPRVTDPAGKWLGIRDSLGKPAHRAEPAELVQVTLGGPKGGIYANVHPRRRDLVQFARDVLAYFGEGT